MDYLTWNDAIGERFFNPDKSGVRVFLYVTTDVINNIGAPYNADLDDFIRAVKQGPPWNTRQSYGLCQQALHTFEYWRGRRRVYPPYLSYLALFVLADTVDAGHARHAYYPGLRLLLGEEITTGMYPSFNRMYLLWEDLAVWSNQDMQGDWGIFDADIVGEWMHVGLPRAQTLLTDEEREKLPFIFTENGLDPLLHPSDREIAYLLADDPNNYLRHYTKELLKSNRDSDSSIRSALVEVILDELAEWDGTVPAQLHTGERLSRVLGTLRLTMVLDRTARTACFSLRCTSNREYPEEGLKLIGGRIVQPLYCYEGWRGWSTPLSIEETQMNVFDPSALDWLESHILLDNDHGWKTTFSKHPIRVMVNAAPLGFDGYIEHNQIPQGKLFCILAHEQYQKLLIKWGKECCETFTEVNLISNLPSGWHLYSIKNANSDKYLRDDFPSLSFPTILRIHFRGGLKLKGNQYFNFALPNIEVIGAIDGANVFCNDYELGFDPETGFFSIPDSLCARRLIVEVRRDGNCICRRTLYTLETLAWRDVESVACTDKFGRRMGGENREKCIGPFVNGIAPLEFNSEIFLPPSLGHHVYFIGRYPGQIVKCPDESIPDDWQPVWAIQKQRRGRGTAIYCGTDLANEEPVLIDYGNHRIRRQYKAVLWHMRKRITAPAQPQLRALWQRYKEVARCVS